MSEAVYLGNPNLKKANVQQEWTKEQIEEFPVALSVKNVLNTLKPTPVAVLPYGPSTSVIAVTCGNS